MQEVVANRDVIAHGRQVIAVGCCVVVVLGHSRQPLDTVTEAPVTDVVGRADVCAELRLFQRADHIVLRIVVRQHVITLGHL